MQTKGSQAPQARAEDADLAFACDAPIILFDAAEPFLPLVVGVTVLRGEADSPSSSAAHHAGIYAALGDGHRICHLVGSGHRPPVRTGGTPGADRG